MTDFNQKQMEVLKGNLTRIAKKVGCSRNYVSLVLSDHIIRNSKKAREIRETASKLLAVLHPEESERIAGAHGDTSFPEIFETSLKEEPPKEKVLNELNDYFVSMISHEFSIPLATILVSADLLDVYFERMSRNEIAQKINRIKKNVIFLKRIIDNVSDLSLFGKGEMKFLPVEQEINSFLSEIIQEHLEVGPCTHILAFKKFNVPLYAGIDQFMIRQVIENLLSNSFKYSPEGSTVGVELSHTKNNIVIAVRDQGIGVPAGEMEMIFEPFKRGSNVGTIHGSGLGLTLSRQFARRHGGDITVNPENDKGTTFRITLPRHR